MIVIKHSALRCYKYRYHGSGIFQNIGRKLSKETVKTLIKSASAKAARKAVDKATEGVGNLVGDIITKQTEAAIGKVTSKPKRKQEYTDIVNSLIQQETKPSDSSSIAGIISGSGIVYD